MLSHLYNRCMRCIFDPIIFSSNDANTTGKKRFAISSGLVDAEIKTCTSFKALLFWHLGHLVFLLIFLSVQRAVLGDSCK